MTDKKPKKKPRTLEEQMAELEQKMAARDHRDGTRDALRNTYTALGRRRPADAAQHFARAYSGMASSQGLTLDGLLKQIQAELAADEGRQAAEPADDEVVFAGDSES